MKTKKILVALLVCIGSYLLPKKKGLLAFFPGHEKAKFSGNLKYFFLHINTTSCGYTAVWLTDNAKVYNEISGYGFAAKRFRYFPLWHFLRAEKILLDTVNWFLPFGRLEFIQLWHGTGFKNIGTLNAVNNTNYRSPIVQSFLKKYIIFVATSEDDQKRKQLSYNCKNVAIVGSPRNDIFFQSGPNRIDYKRKMGLSKFDNVILYTPTFRDCGGVIAFTPSFWQQLQIMLENTNSVFLLKRHPSDINTIVPNNYSNILDFTRETPDVQELLAVTDVLISDYSGIVTDFVLTGRPVIFYIYDFENYLKNERSFYYDLLTTLPGPFATTEKELLELINDREWFKSEDYTQKYHKFVNQFHKFKDGCSCERLLNHLIEQQ